MRTKSQGKTVIGIIKSYIVAWRKREGWSRESVVQAIVDEHVRRGGEIITGIVFDPTTRDAAERQKVNADRVFRWLDDESKDNNLLPANFIPSILDAMPGDVRLHCWEEISNLFGLGAHFLQEQKESQFNPHQHLKTVIKESGEAESALADLTEDQGIKTLQKAHREVSDMVEAGIKTREEIEARIALAQGAVH